MRVGLVVLLMICSVAAAASDSFTRYHELRARDDVPLNVVESGNPAGVPIIFLHGFSQSHLVWRRQFEDAALRKDFRLIALDLRGHGGSGKPWTTDSYAGHQRWAEDIRTIVDTLGLQRPILVGWSFGGYVAFDYVREYGEAAVSGVVLAGSHGGLVDRLPGGGATNASGDLDKLIVDARAFAALMTATPATVDVSDSMAFSYAMLPTYVRQAMREKRLDNTDLRSRLTLPLAVILGESDPSIPADLVAAAIASNPQATLEKYPAVGHSPFIEAPARFNEDLQRFVQRTAKSSNVAVEQAHTPVPVPQVVFDYLRAVNAGNSLAAVESFAADGEMHLLQSRIARGHAEILEVERFHEIARPQMWPRGLHAWQRADGELIVGFEENVEQSAVFSAMGLPRVRTQPLTEAFIVREGKIGLARQPAFIEPCERVLKAAMQSAVSWLIDSADPRRLWLIQEGAVRMDSSTIGAWIFALRDWRAATAWSPGHDEIKNCGGGS